MKKRQKKNLLKRHIHVNIYPYHKIKFTGSPFQIIYYILVEKERFICVVPKQHDFFIIIYLPDICACLDRWIGHPYWYSF